MDSSISRFLFKVDLFYLILSTITFVCKSHETSAVSYLIISLMEGENGI